MINVNEKSLQEKVLDATRIDKIYNSRKYQIINTRNPLL